MVTNPYAGVLEVSCLEKLKSCGLHQQLLIRHQIAILETEIASAQQLIEEYEAMACRKRRNVFLRNR